MLEESVLEVGITKNQGVRFIELVNQKLGKE